MIIANLVLKSIMARHTENTFLQNVNDKPLYFLLSDKVFLYWLTTFFLTLNVEEAVKAVKAVKA